MSKIFKLLLPLKYPSHVVKGFKHCSFLLLSLSDSGFQSRPPVWKCETSNQQFGLTANNAAWLERCFLSADTFCSSTPAVPWQHASLFWYDAGRRRLVFIFQRNKGSTWLRDGSSTAAVWPPKPSWTGINASLNHHPDLREPPVLAAGSSIS